MLVPIAILFSSGVWRELPFVYHADEPKNFDTTVAMLDASSLNPHFFRYPSLLFYIQGAVLAPFEIFGDPEATPRIALGSARATNPAMFAVGRSVTVLFALAAVALAMVMARRVSHRWTAVGIVAAAAGLSPMMIGYSSDITPDMYATAFATAAVVASLSVLARGRPRDYAAAGLFVGLAASSKYNIAFVGISLVAAHLLRPDRRQVGNLVMAGAIAVATFALTTPYALLDFETFREDLTYEMQHYSRGHPGSRGSSPFAYPIALWRLHGALPLLALLAFARRAWWREVTVIASFVVCYVVFVSQYPVRFERTILPVVPSLMVLVALGITAVMSWCRGRSRTVATWAIVALFVFPTIKSAELIRDGLIDDRAAARTWLAALPPGERVLVSPYAPWVDPERQHVEAMGRIREPETYEGRYDYLVLAHSYYGRYFKHPAEYEREIAQWEALFAAFPIVARFDQDGNEILILAAGGVAGGVALRE